MLDWVNVFDQRDLPPAGTERFRPDTDFRVENSALARHSVGSCDRISLPALFDAGRLMFICPIGIAAAMLALGGQRNDVRHCGPTPQSWPLQ
jgi:hypothetical protein